MNKFLILFLPSLLLILSAPTAWAGDYPETYSFEQKSDKDSCLLELKLDEGAYEKVTFKLNTLGNKTLTDEEVALGISRAWLEEVTWQKQFQGKKLLWKETLIEGISKKIAQETFAVEDKLKTFFTSDNGNFRAIFDLLVKIVPVEDGKAADLYFVAVRNSSKSAKDLFNEKFSDDAKNQALRDDKSLCFNIDTTVQENADVNGVIWGAKRLVKK